MTLLASFSLFASGLQQSPSTVRLWMLVGSAGLVLCLLALAIFAGLFCVSVGRRRLERAEERVWVRLAPYFSGREGLVMAAVELLDEFPDRAVASVLRRCRREFGGEATNGASVALSMIGETSRLCGEIQSPLRVRRLSAARRLGDCGGRRASDGLVSLLEHPCERTRQAARLALLQCGDEPALRAALASYAADRPNPRRVGRFVRQLVQRAPELLVEAVRSGGLAAPHRRMILDSLCERAWPGAAVLLSEQLSSCDPEVRAAAIRLASKLRDWPSRGRLLEMLGDDTWYVRAAAASALGRLPSGDGVEALVPVLSDRRAWVRRKAAGGLVRHGDAGIGALLRALREPGRAGEAARVALFEVGLGSGPEQAREAS